LNVFNREVQGMEGRATSELVASEVVGWRFEELVRAGYDDRAALVLAAETDIDLHLACDLLRSDCPPDLALRILT
jgi:hypothetical protein